MNALFVYGALTLEKVGNTYYHNFLGDIINRYKIFGHLTICTLVRNVKSSAYAIVDLDRIVHYALNKENTIYSRFINRKYNKKLLEAEVQKADVLIVHLPSSEGCLAAHYARKYHKPYLAVIVGCPWDALWNYGYKGKLLAPISYWQTRKTVEKANYVQYVTQKFLQCRYPNHAFQIGCSDVYIASVDQQNGNILRKRISQWTQSSCRRIATIASVDVAYKGQIYIIEAIARINRLGYNYHYHLIGGGHGNVLKKKVKQLKLENFVHFEGPISHEKIFEKLSEMDIYAQPSKLEGLPRSIVEAMSVGLPVIASRVGGIPELVEDDFLFEVGSVNEIVGLLQSDNQLWVTQSEINQERATEYLYNRLENRRDDFLNKCLEDVNSKCNIC